MLNRFNIFCVCLLISDKEDTNNNVDSSDEETAQEKRLRLAKEYLVQLETEG